MNHLFLSQTRLKGNPDGEAAARALHLSDWKVVECFTLKIDRFNSVETDTLAGKNI